MSLVASGRQYSRGGLERAALCALLAVAASLFYVAIFADLPVLVEARDFIHFRGQHADLDLAVVLRGIFEPTGYNSRSVSMMSLRLTADLCGYDNRCLNLVQIAMITATGILVFVHVVQICGRTVPAVFVALFWYCSLATLDALGWQATNHDKVALLAAMSALVACFSLLRKEGPAWTLVTNLVLTTLVALAFNAKEIAFYLVYALPLQAVLFSERSVAGYRRSLSKIVLPTLYSVGFVTVYFIRLRPEWVSHTLEGSAVRNAVAYAHGLLNLTQADFQIRVAPGGLHTFAAIVFYAALAVAVLAISASVLRTAASKRDGISQSGLAMRVFDAVSQSRPLHALVYFAALAAGSLIAVTRARFAAPYYLLTPAVGFLAFTTCAFDYATDLWPRRASAVKAAAFALVAVLLLGGFVQQLAPGGRSRVVLDAAANLNESFATIRNVAVRPAARYNFVLDGVEPWFQWLFFDNMNAEKGFLMNFVFERPGSYVIAYPLPGDPDLDRAGEYYFHLNRELRLTAIALGGEKIR